MNPWDNNTAASDDRRFDLLVDGELGEPERRQLLQQLERETGGWRRLALAFLEAQAWKQAMGAMAGEAPATAATATAVAASAPTAVVPPQSQPRSLPLGRLGTSLAMAASFLLAAILGLMVVRDRTHPAIPGSGTVAVDDRGMQSPRAFPGSLVSGNTVSGHTVPGNLPTNFAPGKWTLPVVPPQSAVASAGSQGPWQTVRVSLPGGPQGTEETIEVPAIERDRVDDAWLSSLPAALPPEVLGALHGRGYEVRQRRDLLPVNLQDGRGLVVPVDQVELRYVGGQKWQ